MMGGRIWVESERAGAARFTSPRASACRRAAVPTGNVAIAMDRLQGLPVLVVDDNATNRRILQEMLTQLGHEPNRPSADGPAALARHAARRRGRRAVSARSCPTPHARAWTASCWPSRSAGDPELAGADAHDADLGRPPEATLRRCRAAGRSPPT